MTEKLNDVLENAVLPEWHFGGNPKKCGSYLVVIKDEWLDLNVFNTRIAWFTAKKGGRPYWTYQDRRLDELEQVIAWTNIPAPKLPEGVVGEKDRWGVGSPKNVAK